MGNTVLKLITNRRGKYFIIVFWVVMAAVAAPLAGQLTDVEKNEAKSWLPGTAESTRALEAQSAFASPNSLPAVVVYERSSGLTQADQQKIAADAVKYGQLGDLDGKVIGPIPAADGGAGEIGGEVFGARDVAAGAAGAEQGHQGRCDHCGGETSEGSWDCDEAHRCHSEAGLSEKERTRQLNDWICRGRAGAFFTRGGGCKKTKSGP